MAVLPVLSVLLPMAVPPEFRCSLHGGATCSMVVLLHGGATRVSCIHGDAVVPPEFQ